MKITGLHIGHFGKLKALSLEFGPKLNVIYGPNEAGKTTVLAFIKAMLYGMNSQKHDIRDNDRLRFLPWGGETAQGALYVTDPFKGQIKITRLFGTRRREPVTITDSLTGQAVSGFAQSEPGEVLLGLGEEAFLRTLCIPQLSAAVTPDKKDEIMAKLMNIQQTGDEEVSVNKALAALATAKKQLTLRSENGRLDRAWARKAELNLEKEEFQRLHQESLEERLALNRLMQRQETVNKALLELAEKRQFEKRRKNRLIIKKLKQTQAELLALKAQTQELSRGLICAGQEVDEPLLAEAKEVINEWQQLQELADGLAEERNHYVSELEAFEGQRLSRDKEDTASALEGRRARRRQDCPVSGVGVWKTIALLGALIVLVSLVAAAFLDRHALYLTPLGLLSGFYGLQRLRAKQKVFMEGQKQRVVLQSRIHDRNQQIESYRQQMLERERWVAVKLEQEGGQAESMLQALQRIKDLETGWHKRNGLEVEIKTRQEHYEERLRAFNATDMEGFCFETLGTSDSQGAWAEEEETAEDGGLSETELEQHLCDLNREKIELVAKVTALQGGLEARFKSMREICLIEEELELNQQDLAQAQEMLEAINFAAELMSEAFRQVQSGFGPLLNKKVGALVHELTAGKYGEVHINQQVQLRMVDEQGWDRDLHYFSQGTLDQVYFALRVGISELIFEGVSPRPLILDDSFVQYDDRRLAAVLDFLVNYSREHQILLLTCQHREVDYLRGKDAKIISLEA